MSDWAAANERLERASPRERLAWATETFGESLLFTSSFGAGSAVLLQMWSEVAPAQPVVFIDTGFLFEETLRYRDALVAKLRLRLEIVRPSQPRADFVRDFGDDVYLRDPDFCCAQNKVLPLEPLRSKARAWISGLRRDQGGERARVPIVLARDNGPIGVHPIATMSRADVSAFMIAHDLPEHPLAGQGYASIGCAPCTRRVEAGEDERAGRWAWSSKTECGLHVLRRKTG
jgi:phosphoadenosine phosphosulfate reductase